MIRFRKYVQMLVFALAILQISCGGKENSRKTDSATSVDTAAFIASWKMNEAQMLSELFLADTFYNQLSLDTMELTYSMFDGPDWIDRTKGDIDCRECTDFYIEAADKSLILPSEFRVSGNTVQFYGIVIPGVGLPNDREFTNDNPLPWTVFRYYGYKVIRPYKVWLPESSNWVTIAE